MSAHPADRGEAKGYAVVPAGKHQKVKNAQGKLRTVGGVAGEGYLDRLAETVYELEAVVDPLLGLNDDGSVDIGYLVGAEDVHSALRSVDAIIEALRTSKPLRDQPDLVDRIQVVRVSQPESIPA